MATINLTTVLNGEDKATIEAIVEGMTAYMSPLTTKGDIYTYSTGETRLPIGTDDQVLISDSTAATGLKWGAASAGSATQLSIGTVTATTFGITSDGSVNDVILPEANTTQAGVLGADKWDEIVANSLKDTNVTTDLTQTTAAAQLTIHSSDGADIVVAEASGTIAGLMTTTHHDKLDGIAANADVTSTSETSHTDVVVDGDFTSNGVLNRTGAGAYSILVVDTDLQSYDSDTVKYDVAGNFSTLQGITTITSEDNSIAFNSGNNLSFTATAANITVTNQTVDNGGTLIIASAENITGFGTEFDWGNQGEPTDLTGVETFGYFISGASGVDSIKIGRV